MGSFFPLTCSQLQSTSSSRISSRFILTFKGTSGSALYRPVSSRRLNSFSKVKRSHQVTEYDECLVSEDAVMNRQPIIILYISWYYKVRWLRIDRVPCWTKENDTCRESTSPPSRLLRKARQNGKTTGRSDGGHRNSLCTTSTCIKGERSSSFID